VPVSPAQARVTAVPNTRVPGHGWLGARAPPSPCPCASGGVGTAMPVTGVHRPVPKFRASLEPNFTLRVKRVPLDHTARAEAFGSSPSTGRPAARTHCPQCQAPTSSAGRASSLALLGKAAGLTPSLYCSFPDLRHTYVLTFGNSSRQAYQKEQRRRAHAL